MFKSAAKVCQHHLDVGQAAGTGGMHKIILHLGQALIGLRRFDDANDLVDRFLAEEAPLKASDQVYLAETMADLGRLREARLVVEQVLAKDPTHRRANELLATIERLGE